MLSPDAKSRPFALDVDGRQVPLYDEEDFAGLHRAGQLAAQTLDFITPFVEPGVTTEALDDRMHQFIIAQGATPATLGYKGYPKSLYLDHCMFATASRVPKAASSRAIS